MSDSLGDTFSDDACLVDGSFLVVDKPVGVTSHDVVAAARANLHTKKVGHAGTLDPFATGVLVIGVGYATKLLRYVTDASKEYIATVRLGLWSSTDDLEGEIAAQSTEQSMAVQRLIGLSMRASGSQSLMGCIADVVGKKFTGKIQQVPSSFSAIKVDGRRAYDLARAGLEVTLQPREVEVFAFDILDVRCGEETVESLGSGDSGSCDSGSEQIIDVDIRVECSAGTYIRALARDLGKELGTGGYLTRLRRTRVAGFVLCGSDSYSVVKASTVRKEVVSKRTGERTLRNKVVFDVPDGDLRGRLCSPLDVIADIMPVFRVSDQQVIDISFGRAIAVDSAIAAGAAIAANSELAAVYGSQIIATLEPANLHGRRVLQPTAVFIPQLHTSTNSNVDASVSVVASVSGSTNEEGE